ncbi:MULTISPECIES: GGDEF domain-containing protein [Methylorubrum]|uniref:GGDEF domain-containing protein n=1 Tax=Methylorubrum TaxID=2282523 RepID=UPI001645FB63|nr:GGDEF domain-containing protein [Methylorubrum populi]
MPDDGNPRGHARIQACGAPSAFNEKLRMIVALSGADAGRLHRSGAVIPIVRSEILNLMDPTPANRETIDATHLDSLLRFSPSVAEQYEDEHGRRREADLRRNALVGICIFNVYNVTGSFLMPDITALALAVRLLFFTPVALLLVWSIGRVCAVWRERLMLTGMTGAIVPPAMLFWLTQAPLGAYSVAEILLAVLFGNIVLTLRFTHAIIMTAISFVVGLLAIITKVGLEDGLRLALLLQLATACGCSLYANHQMEARRCRDYLVGLRVRMLRDMAEQARQRFQDLSQTDALTGLPNRRALDLCLDAWLSNGGSVAMLMIDIDHFKRFNDSLGHPEGDICLRRVAETLAASTFGREDCLCARYGGEEFAVVLKDAGRAEAARLADDLVRAVAALGLRHPGRRDTFRIVTASIGVASNEQAGAGFREDPKAALVTMADRALYRAKQGGRNRAVVYDPPPVVSLAG